MKDVFGLFYLLNHRVPDPTQITKAAANACHVFMRLPENDK